MALQSSGAISLNDIQTEFGGTNPISMSEYYRGGSFVTDNNTSIPTSGAINMNGFYGATKQFTYTFSENAQEVDLNTVTTAAGWNGSDPITVVVNSDVTISSDDTSVAALTISSAFNGLLTITNNGKIHGRGGNGSTGTGGDGGDAISNGATGVTLTNASGAFIAGGGGGGGGGLDSNLQSWAGGGGAGGGQGAASQIGSSGNGGTVLQLGTFVHPTSNLTVPYMYGGGGGSYSSGGTRGADGLGLPGTGNANGGGSGAAGGAGRGYGNSVSGAGGGLYGNSFTTMTGGLGGSGGQAGGGGGGWGASGGSGSGTSGSGSGGAGGAAISGTAIATYTNNGTVYGSVA